MNVDQEVKELREKCAGIRAQIKWLIANQSKLADLPALGSCVPGAAVDFDNLEHKDVIKVVKAFGGKWKKTANSQSGKVDYSTEINGTIIRCWAAQAPPSCKLIEVEEHVPEQVIPAHTVKKYVMKCHPDIGAVVASAAAKTVQPSADLPL